MANLNDRPRVFHRLAGRASRLQSEAHAQAGAPARHAGLLRRLGGRPIASPAAADTETRRSLRSRTLLRFLARRG